MVAMRRVRRSEDGAAAVEFALLFPIFIILVIGMMSAGTAFSKQLNLTQAARETSRFGSTLTFTAAGGDVDDWLTAVTAVGQAAGGDPQNPIGGVGRVCVAMVDELVAANNRRMVDGGPPEPGACFTVNSGLGPKYVQVQMQRDTAFFAVFLKKDLVLETTSTTPYEPGNIPAAEASASPAASPSPAIP